MKTSKTESAQLFNSIVECLDVSIQGLGFGELFSKYGFLCLGIFSREEKIEFLLENPLFSEKKYQK